MKRKIYLSLVVALLVLVSAFLYKSYRPIGQLDKNNEIVIGAILSLSGSTSSFYGEYNKNALDLYVEELNKKGGIGGKKVRIEYQDSKGDKVAAIQAFNLMHAQGIRYFIADISPVVVGIAPMANEKKSILVGTSASNPTITNMGEYIFRTKLSAETEGKIAAEYLSTQLKPKSVAFLYQSSDYGVGVFNSFGPIIKASGVKVLAEEKYDKDSTDMRTQLAKIRQQNPEILIMAGFPKEVGRIIKQAKEIGINAKLFAHSGSIGPDIELIAGSSSSGMLYFTELHEDGARFKEFKDTYIAKYDVAPELFAANTYDAITLLVNGIGQCGGGQGSAGVTTGSSVTNYWAGLTEVDCVKNNLASTKGFQGVVGNITFDKNGDLIERELILKVR